MAQNILIPEKKSENQGPQTAVELLHDAAFITKAAECVRTAKSSIKICAYAWVWYENSPTHDIQKFNYAIAQKAKLGVDIQAILNRKTQANYLRHYGIKTRTFPSDRTMHTKAILIDEKILILGSHNLSLLGTARNFEVSVLIQDVESCLQFDEYFTKMWRNFGVK